MPSNEILNDFESKEFSTICEERFTKQVIENGLIKNDLFGCLKPHIFDSLKRLNRLTQMKKELLEFMSLNNCDDKWKHLKNIEERDLICLTIKSLGSISKAKFGALLVKNDYPCPIIFNDWETSVMVKEPKRYDICFELFSDLLSIIRHKSLIINSGTKNSSFKGKSSLIPLLFDDISNNCVFKSTKDNLRGAVDLICNSSDWIIADFHSEIETNDSKNLLKALSEFSIMHIFNVTIEDFESNGELIKEVREMFECYDVLKHKSTLTQLYVIILIRDYENENSDMFKKICDRYNKQLSIVLVVSNISDLSNDAIALKAKNLILKMTQIMSKLTKKSIHSINDVKDLYNKLSNGQDFHVRSKEFTIELDFLRIFKNFESNTNVFPIANKNFEIYEITENLNKCGYYYSKRDDLDLKLNRLKSEFRQVNPFSTHIIFFIEIIIGPNFISNIIILENLFIEMKKEKIESLRKIHAEKQKSLDQTCYKIKHLELMGSSKSNELPILKNEKENTEREIKNLNKQIDLYDLTVDKFWDEVFSIYDWILDMEKQNVPFIDDDLNNYIQKFKLKINLIISRYIELIEYGFSIHVLRGTPLKIQSKPLEMVFEKLNSNQELYIIS